MSATNVSPGVRHREPRMRNPSPQSASGGPADLYGTGEAATEPINGHELIPGTVDGNAITASTITARAIAAGTLGVRELTVGVDGNLLRNGGFEFGTDAIVAGYVTSSLDTYGWTVQAATMVNYATSAVARGVYRALIQSTDGATTAVRIEQYVPVIAGRRYRISGWMAHGASAGNSIAPRINVATYDRALAQVNGVFAALNHSPATSTTMTYYVTEFDIPSDASVAFVRIDCRFNGVAALSEIAVFDDVTLTLVPDRYQNVAATVRIDEDGVTILDGALTFIDPYGTTVLTGAGVGPAWGRFFSTGVYNGDFFAETPTQASNIDNATNPLPYWSFVKSSGTAITAKSEADTAVASGNVIRWAMASGAAGDNSYLQQIIPVSGSPAQDESHTVIAEVWVRAGSVLGHDWYLSCVYLQNDGSTVIGSAVEVTSARDGHPTAGIARLACTPADSVPANAYYLRIRVGVKRDTAANGTTDTQADFKLYDLRLLRGATRVIISGNDDSFSGNPIVEASYFDQNSDRVVLRMPGATVFSSDLPYSWPRVPVIDKPSANYAVTTTLTDVTGSSVAFTTGEAETVLVDVVADIDVSVAGVGFVDVQLDVNGTSEAEFCQYSTASTGRATVAQNYLLFLAANTSYTLKLRAIKSINAGTATVIALHTTVRVQRQGSL